MSFALLLLYIQLAQPFSQALRCQIDQYDLNHYWYVHGYSPAAEKPKLISIRPKRMDAFKDCDKWLKEQETPKKKAEKK